jgi:hypothetical protein
MRNFHGWLSLGVGSIGVVAGVAIASVPARSQVSRAEDAANVTVLLTSMRGTGSLACGLALSAVEGNYWGNWGAGQLMTADTATTRIRRWLANGIEDPSVVPALRAGLTGDDPCVRQVAARVLGRIHHPQAVAALAEALRTTDPAIRELAAVGLGFGEETQAYDPLVGALRDAEPRVRVAVALALGRLGDDRATRELVPLLQRDRVPQVRQAAAYALGELD